MYRLQFAFSNKSGNVVVAAVLMDEVKLSPIYKKIDIVEYDGTNQYDMILMALDNAISLLIENEIQGEICLETQNSVLISWLEKQHANPAYQYRFEKILNRMSLLATRCEFFVKQITEKENIAKRYCKEGLARVESKTRRLDIKPANVVYLKNRRAMED